MKTEEWVLGIVQGTSSFSLHTPILLNESQEPQEGSESEIALS